MQRSTQQRRTIQDLFTKAGRPLSPQELVDLAAQAISPPSLTTVYRTVKSMVEAGQVVTVDLPGQPPRYELAGLAHHHHFLCDDCGRMYDIPGCPKTVHSLAPKGFRTSHHELTLVGTCPECP